MQYTGCLLVIYCPRYAGVSTFSNHNKHNIVRETVPYLRYSKIASCRCSNQQSRWWALRTWV